MANEQKFKFNFLIVDRDITLTDQNVHSYRFVNIGGWPVLINNQLYLGESQGTALHNFFDENMQAGEKTAQGYQIRFIQPAQPTSGPQLQIIMKMPVNS